METEKKLPKGITGVVHRVVDDYNEHFQNYPKLQLPYSVVVKHLPKLMSAFNKKWHPKEIRNTYLQTFSLDAWATMVSEEEKNDHIVSSCNICLKKYQLLLSAFPGSPPITESTEPPSITLSAADMSSPRKLGRTVLAEMNPICRAQFNLSPQQVLQKTPKFVCTPTANENQKKKPRIVLDTKRVLHRRKWTRIP